MNVPANHMDEVSLNGHYLELGVADGGQLNQCISRSMIAVCFQSSCVFARVEADFIIVVS